MKNKISTGRIIIAGIIFAVIAEIIHSIGAYASMKYYTMPEYFPVWSKIMMPSAGPPPTSFMIYGLVFSFITGFLLAMVYSVIKEGIPAKALNKKGLIFGLLLFLIAGIPGALSMYLLINLPIALIIGWTIEDLIVYLVGGIVIARINK
jgi:uncharacterized membrane protein YeaQ/YmgE (transglycosylase-associated protein family)